MIETFHIGPLGPLDLTALVTLVGAWLLIGHLTEHPPAHRPSVGKLMEGYRREWMRQLVTRQPRIFDSAMIDGLRQSTTFFASTALIAIGGGLALIGNPEQLTDLAQEFALASGPKLLWETRILTAVLFGANAFLKFVWSHRLFSYAAIAMAAVPNDATDPLAYPRAEQAARLNINAAKSFNRGLRAVYFALASLAWLLGPWALIGASLFTFGMLWRREFASVARQALLENPPA
ncbi:hypothetical protein LPB142_15015 [Rhodobacter xanthinilyticus]|uniref:DUF599 domain-containing protein n=1 Tax=Rhodobacter xanthinilyticus TaxID=1850250 RepID=A0A1D9MF26_9RHOB|nr:DUF599 domain-containing protein [Rhodobacter xanthinilyticus]AOZ70481.1 hypothetical protein LPB142_15015 [Rhodobacter xanthinilyticus]